MTLDAAEYFKTRSVRDAPKRNRKRLTPGKGITTKGGPGSPWKHTRTGMREDLGIVLRSSWEANVCRVLRAWDIKFEFEPMVFTYPIKRGNKGYCPDLYLPKTKEWIEVKGYFDKNSRIKLKRFAKYYPAEFARLTMIIGNAKQSIAICEALNVPYLFYQDVSLAFRDRVSNWEGI